MESQLHGVMLLGKTLEYSMASMDDSRIMLAFQVVCMDILTLVNGAVIGDRQVATKVLSC